MINITSFSLCILSRIAASGEIKFGCISLSDPKDKFHTFMSLFAFTISSMVRNIVNELKCPLVATPKCLTLNLPQPSSSSGLIVGPSTMIDDTDVP